MKLLINSAHCNRCKCLWMLGLELIHASKRGHRTASQMKGKHNRMLGSCVYWQHIHRRNYYDVCKTPIPPKFLKRGTWLDATSNPVATLWSPHSHPSYFEFNVWTHFDHFIFEKCKCVRQKIKPTIGITRTRIFIAEFTFVPPYTVDTS